MIGRLGTMLTLGGASALNYATYKSINEKGLIRVQPSLNYVDQVRGEMKRLGLKRFNHQGDIFGDLKFRMRVEPHSWSYGLKFKEFENVFYRGTETISDTTENKDQISGGSWWKFW